jgi:hypothetical protein
VDGDGVDEVIYTVAGRVILKSLNDQEIWRSEPIGAARIEALLDLDGDHSPELVVSSERGAHIVRVADGRVAWSLPAGHIGSTGALRIADFDQNGLPDIYIADLACGSLGSLGDAAEVWSFEHGAESPTRLFELEKGRRAADYVCGLHDTIADLDGDGTLEIITQGSNFFHVYSGVDGRLISVSEPVGSIPYGEAIIRVGNMNADAGMELIAFVNSSYAPPLNSRRVFMLDWDANARRLVRRWEHSVVDPSVDRHEFGVGGVGDINADGTPDVVSSFYRGSAATWRTAVWDGATGEEIAAVAAGPFRGLADLDGDGRKDVVAGDRQRGTSVFRWSEGHLGLWYTEPRFEPIQVRVRDATAPSAAVYELVVQETGAPAIPELLGFSFGSDSASPEALVLLSGQSDLPRASSRTSLRDGVTVTFVTPVRGGPQGENRIGIVRSDGYLRIVAADLRPLDASDEFSVSAGIQLGGYYSGLKGVGRAPLAGDVDGDGASEVVVVDSRSVLRVLRSNRGVSGSAPQQLWEQAGSQLPVLLDANNDGAMEVAYWTTTPDAAALRVASASDGTLMWQRTLGSYGVYPVNDLMVGDLDRDGSPELVYSLYSTDRGTLRINALASKSGAETWTNDYEAVVSGSGFGVGSLGDRNGDGAEDVLAAPSYHLQWLDGPTGILGDIADADYADYGLVANPDISGQPEIVGSGALYGVSTYDLKLSRRWRAPETHQARINGAIVSCANGRSFFVAGHDGSARVSAWDLENGAIVGDVVLANGIARKSVEGASLGTGLVGSLVASRDLTGNGEPAVLVPSTDGYLYALNPCDMSLVWALDLRSPVGEPAMADIDGDGQDEIILTAADGYLYAIDGEPLAAPSFVYDNDGHAEATSESEEVDVLSMTDSLSANWSPVDGATSYEVGVIDDTGKYLSVPELRDVGNATSGTVTGLLLKVGKAYSFVVRAVGANGASAVMHSDGVTMSADPCDACGEGTSCDGEYCVAQDAIALDGGHEIHLCDTATDARIPAACAACGPGTCCQNETCVASHRVHDGCGCSLTESGSTPIAHVIAGLLVAVFGRRRRMRERCRRNDGSRT